ncbi:MAG: lysophospholipid acyltransferase family protein [Planctomycetota bacterium]
MSLLNNRVSVGAAHGLFRRTSRYGLVGREHLPRQGEPYVLAAAHLSHYDPVVIGALLNRTIDWMAREAFYEGRWSRWACERAGCVRVDRFGPALPGIREGLGRLARGRTLGVFPDGEIRRGGASVLGGASVKAGAVLLARRGGVPVVPCVVLNSEQFRRVTPWLPLRRGRLWLGLGPALRFGERGAGVAGRVHRRAEAERLAEALRSVYRAMDRVFELPDGARP